MNILEYISQPNWCIKLKKSKTREAYLIRQSLIVQTPFLPEDATLQQRAWHIINNQNSVPTCPMCNNNLKFQKSGNYSKYCSQKCVANSPETTAKKLKTNIKKYGSEEAYREASAKKLKNISMEKYGVENLFQSQIVKEKSKETMQKKYGVSHPSESTDILIKRKQTMVDRYGVEHALQSPDSKNKFIKTMRERFGVEYALQSDAVQEQMRKKFAEQYGVVHHTQIPISDASISLLNDSDWLRKAHHDERKTLNYISEYLGVDKTTVSRYMEKHGIEVKYYSNSLPERDIVDFLNSLGFSVETNVRNVISPLELDIYIPSNKLAIEYCGLFWHSDLRKPKTYHQDKYEQCKHLGIRLLTIFENEWIENPDRIKTKIAHILNVNSKDTVYARKTKVIELNNEQKKNFFNENHIQGNGPSSINYGLVYNDNVVAAIGFIKQSDGSFILNRYATSNKVVGGFTKLLTYFENKYNYPTIISFADLRWSDGNMYEVCGFELEKTIPPDYSWCKDKQLWHKFSWRHTTGLKTLPQYDPSLSEYMNMSSHGYYRIWDCGKLKYIKNKKGA